jgi:hypothetical protein
VLRPVPETTPVMSSRLLHPPQFLTSVDALPRLDTGPRRVLESVARPGATNVGA